MVVEKIQIETLEIDLKDTQIFKAIFNMFYPRAYTFTLKLLRDEVISADITQEAFLYMWEKAYRLNLRICQLTMRPHFVPNTNYWVHWLVPQLLVKP